MRAPDRSIDRFARAATASVALGSPGIPRDARGFGGARAAAVESEARYRALFEAVDEGYLLAEVLLDDGGQPVDLLYLEANPAAVRMTRTEYDGRRLLEIDPNFEPYWLEIWGRVARTGVGERLERYAAPLGTWFDFFVTRVGGEGSRRVAVVFQDVTARNRAEAERERRVPHGAATRRSACGRSPRNLRRCT